MLVEAHCRPRLCHDLTFLIETDKDGSRDRLLGVTIELGNFERR